jgi:hypothetical protein
VKFADRQPHPVIFRNLGNRDGLPRFEEFALGVNDFPTAEDRAIKRSGPFFEKMVADRKIVYTAPGPTCDFDHDGRLDMFLPNWWAELPSMLLRNETEGGNWLEVQIDGADGVNRMGVGSRILILRQGKSGEREKLLGYREIATGFGYASSQEAVAHFGLGSEERVHVQVVFPHGKGSVNVHDVKVNQRITVKRQ